MQSFARLLILSTLVAFAAPLRAQTAAPSDTPDTAAVSPSVVRDTVAQPAPVELAAPVAAVEAGATTSRVDAAALRAGAHVSRNTQLEAPKFAGEHANLGQARSLMIVGAAAMIAGGVIGDDPGVLIMIGGAVVGLYGLYEYLQ